MVITKTGESIDLILPTGSNAEPVRRKLATINYNFNPPEYTFSSEVYPPAINRYLNQKVDVNYKIEDLVMAYIQGVQFVEKLSDNIKKARLTLDQEVPIFKALSESKMSRFFSKRRRSDYAVRRFQSISETPFTYVLPSAKNGVIETEMGNYNYEKGIFVLSGNYSISDIRKTVIHELGHCLHDITEPAAYKQSSNIMTEVMAIFTEETEKINPPNLYGKSPHKDASDFLQRLRKIPFYKQLNAAEQWLYLSGFTNHNLLEEDINAAERKQTKPKKKQKCPCPRCSVS